MQWSPTVNFEGVGIVEYRPQLLKTLRLYTRVQGLFNQNFDAGAHERSLLYLRGGITSGSLSAGLGFNMDFYGPEANQEENFGIFFHYVF